MILQTKTPTPSDFELVVKLLEATIWPITLLLIIFFFRKHFASAFNRIGSLKADTSGITMTFASVLNETKKKFNDVISTSSEKSGASINSLKVDEKVPYKQLIEIKESLDNTLTDIAKEKGLIIENKSSMDICQELERKGIISYEKSDLMLSLLKVVNLATLTITQTQVDDIKTLYNNI